MHEARSGAQVDHFERATDLVQRLLHGHGIEHGLATVRRQFRLARETRQRLGRAFERFAQFIDDPCQGPEVLLALRRVGRCRGKKGVSGRHSELPGAQAPV